MRHRLALAGAAVALTAGLAGGGALRAELTRALGPGREMTTPEFAVRTPSAFDAWYPPEGAPPAWVEVGELPAVEAEPPEFASFDPTEWSSDTYLPPPLLAPDPPDWGWAPPDGSSPDPALHDYPPAAAG